MSKSWSSEGNPIDAFFERYPSFNYQGPIRDWRQIVRFNALAASCGWTQDQRNNEFQKLKRAWTQVVESEFSGSSISHYQTLCGDLDISPVPGTIPECKNALKGVYVNIVDLVQYRTDRQLGLGGMRPTKFESLEELRDYSDEEKKYYPKQNAKAEMLQVLLREL